MSKRASNINLRWDKRNPSSELATLIPDYFFHQKKQFLACNECMANGANFCEAPKNLKLFHYHLSPCNQPYHSQKLKETPSFNISITSGNRLHTLRKGKGKRPSPCKWLASFNNLLPYAGWFRDHFLHLPWIRYFMQVKTSRPHHLICLWSPRDLDKTQDAHHLAFLQTSSYLKPRCPSILSELMRFQRKFA